MLNNFFIMHMNQLCRKYVFVVIFTILRLTLDINVLIRNNTKINCPSCNLWFRNLR